jgi:AraC-like DNA-binding protein
VLPSVLERPLLLGTPWAATVDGSESLAVLLSQTYSIRDLEPGAPKLHKPQPFQLQVAFASLGEVTLTSVLGDPITLEVDPLQSLCLLALPSAGWGQYRIDGDQLDNSVGQTVAFLPPCGWRLVNDVTAGTALQFRQASLISRIQAIAGDVLGAAALGMLLSSPFTVSTTEPRNHYYYRHLLAALSMVDSSFRSGTGQPDPMLCLDDLILRCIALLLHPTLTELDARGDGTGMDLHLRRRVHVLMDWMRSNLHRPISLSEIERKAQYGRRSIQLGFKAEVGCGPMQWLRRQRLDLARQRLLSGEPGLTVTQVAQACGYINLASFSRDFRERFGIGARQVLADGRSRHANG